MVRKCYMENKNPGIEILISYLEKYFPARLFLRLGITGVTISSIDLCFEGKRLCFCGTRADDCTFYNLLHRMSIIQHRDNVITLPIVADDNECRPIFSNNQTFLRGNDELWYTRSITFERTLRCLIDHGIG